MTVDRAGLGEIAKQYAALVAALVREKRDEGWTDAAIEAEIERIPAMAREQFRAVYRDEDLVEQIVTEFMSALGQQLKPPSETRH